MIFGSTVNEYANALMSMHDAINAANAATIMSIHDSMRCNCDFSPPVGLPSLSEPCMPISPLYRGVFENCHESQTKRLRCEYCGCLSEKNYGVCEHCGAPL